MRLLKFSFLLAILCALATPGVFGETPELQQLLPDRLGAFRRTESPRASEALKQQGMINPAWSEVEGRAEYSGTGGQRFLVEIIRLHQDGEAYSLLSIVAAETRSKGTQADITSDYGTAGYADQEHIVFFKGLHFVRLTNLTKLPASPAREELAKVLADTIDKGEADIPALIKHLPLPEASQKIATFLPRFSSVQSLMPGQSVLSVIETGGDADAAFADVGSGKVLVVEYNTPQLAKDNDERIIAKIHELWKIGQPAPIGYKRAGNYSVFVFDAKDDATAKQLMDQVKYEQLVQWLGDNPNILREAQKRYVETTLGVFIAVLKASGFALVGCLGLGGLIGALLFTRRRSQQRTHEAYSDAGGMLRLNIDELTPQTDPSRLLGPGQ